MVIEPRPHPARTRAGRTPLLSAVSILECGSKSWWSSQVDVPSLNIIAPLCHSCAKQRIQRIARRPDSPPLFHKLDTLESRCLHHGRRIGRVVDGGAHAYPKSDLPPEAAIFVDAGFNVSWFFPGPVPVVPGYLVSA